jgi:hypothetical protein
MGAQAFARIMAARPFHEELGLADVAIVTFHHFFFLIPLFL